MTNEQRARLNRVGLNPAAFEPKKVEAVRTVQISREDYGLLDVADENIIYYIYDEDGNVSVRKG